MVGFSDFSESASQGDGKYEAKYDRFAIGFADFLIFARNFGNAERQHDGDLQRNAMRRSLAYRGIQTAVGAPLVLFGQSANPQGN